MKDGVFENLGIDAKKLIFTDPQKKAWFTACMQEYVALIKMFHSPETMEYFNNLIAAIMLEYRKAYPNCKITILYRIKSCKSIFDKLVDYFSRDKENDPSNTKCKYGSDPNNPDKPQLLEMMSDVFAMTVVFTRGEETYVSSDPEIQELADQKEHNVALHKAMQKVKIEITESEFSGTDVNNYKFNIERKKYYIYCMLMIDRIKSLIDPKATKLLEEYDNMLERIRQAVPESFYQYVTSMILAMNDYKIDDINVICAMLEGPMRKIRSTNEELDRLDEKFSQEDVDTVDFLSIYNAFVLRIPDNINLKKLTKQFYSIFKESELLKEFDVEFVEGSLKEKRTEKGFVANFAKIKTPFGDVEAQVQSEHENDEANYGYAAHCSMAGKSFELYPLPKEGDLEELEAFREWARFISAFKFKASYSTFVRERISTIVAGKYENLLLLITQVQEGSPLSETLKAYCEEMYRRRDELFEGEKTQEREELFMETDIRAYARGRSWEEKLKNKRKEIDEEVKKIEEREC